MSGVGTRIAGQGRILTVTGLADGVSGEVWLAGQVWATGPVKVGCAPGAAATAEGPRGCELSPGHRGGGRGE